MPARSPRRVALASELAVLMRGSAPLSREVAVQVHPRLGLVSFSTLLRIRDTEPARASDLADYFGIDKAAVSRQLKFLEELGLIDRRADPDDGRARSVQLSQACEKRMSEVQLARNIQFHALIDDWPDHDVDELTRLLKKLNQSVYGH